MVDLTALPAGPFDLLDAEASQQELQAAVNRATAAGQEFEELIDGDGDEDAGSKGQLLWLPALAQPACFPLSLPEPGDDSEQRFPVLQELPGEDDGEKPAAAGGEFDEGTGEAVGSLGPLSPWHRHGAVSCMLIVLHHFTGSVLTALVTHLAWKRIAAQAFLA